MDEPKRSRPEQGIRGGPSRPSTLVNHSELPAVEARERVVRILRMHDLAEKNLALQQLDERDQALVRIIAQEGAAANVEPALRYNAIAALAYGRSDESLNLLTDLAQFGEDLYVRGHALLALGTTGLHLAVSAIAPHLGATERFEQIAAQRAIQALAERSSAESIRAYAALLPAAEWRTAVDQILESMLKTQRPESPRTTPSREKKR